MKHVSSDTVANPQRKRNLASLLAVILCAMGFLSIYGCSLFDEYRKNPNSVFYVPPRSPQASVPLESQGIDEPALGDPIHMDNLLTYNGKTYRYNSNVYNFVLLGVDTTSERDENIYGYNNDVLVVAAIDVQTKTVRMMSFPRDTRTLVQRLNSKGEVVSRFVSKINAAFSNGGNNKQRRYENALDALETLCGGIPFHYYVGIDLDSIAPIVDAVGGVPYTIDVDLSAFGMPKGANLVLTGQQARHYVQERKIPGTGGGDVGRVQRQQKFLLALAKQIKSKNPVELLPLLFTNLQQYYDSNMNLSQVGTLAYLMSSYDLSQLDMQVLPGKPEWMNNESYYTYDRDGLMKWLIETYYVEEN